MRTALDLLSSVKQCAFPVRRLALAPANALGFVAQVGNSVGAFRGQLGAQPLDFRDECGEVGRGRVE